MPDVIITYEETMEFLEKEWLETKDFKLPPRMEQWQGFVNAINNRIDIHLKALKNLLNQIDKDVPEIERAIMNLHKDIAKLYEVRFDSMGGYKKQKGESNEG